MKVVKVKYRTKKFLSEFFIIVWNLLLVFADDELTTYDHYEDPLDDSDGTDLLSNLISNSKQFRQNDAPPVLERNEAKPYPLEPNKTTKFLYIMQTEQKPITFTVVPCLSNLTITWTLHFRNKKNIGAVVDSSSSGRLLNTYEGLSMTYVTCEPQFGLFELSISSFDESTIVDVSAIDSDIIAPFLQLADDENAPRQIGVKFNFKNHSVIIRWSQNFPPENYLQMNYVVTVNSKRFLTYICETSTADTYEMLPDLRVVGKFFESSYSLHDLKYNQKYYVNVFALHKTLLSVPYGKTSFVFRKTKPTGLRRNELVRGDLRSNDGKLSYKYKVSRLASPTDVLVWYVFPCGGMVLVEIKHKKKIVRKHTIREFTAFIIQKPIPGQRYVVKLTDIRRNERNPLDFVDVLVTTNAGYNNSLLILPSNVTVFVHKISSDCFAPERSTTIGWWPVVNGRSIVYCVRVVELDPESEKTSAPFPNRCDTDAVERSDANTKTNEECYEKHVKSPGKAIIQKVRKLKPDRSYLIRVTAKKYNQKTIASYNLLKISKNIDCVVAAKTSS